MPTLLELRTSNKQLPTPPTPKIPLPPDQLGHGQQKAQEPAPVSRPPPSAATPSIQHRSGVMQPQPGELGSTNLAGRVQPEPQDRAPKDQRTNKLGLDRPMVKPATGQSALASGSLIERQVTAVVPTAPQEQPALVHQKSELNTYQIPISSLGAGSVASRGPLGPKSSASLRETHAQVSYGYGKTLEENTVSTLRSRQSVDPESSKPVPVPTTPSPLIVSLSDKSYAIT